MSTGTSMSSGEAAAPAATSEAPGPAAEAHAAPVAPLATPAATQTRGAFTLRGQLLRWLLVPLSLIFLIDVAGSYYFARRVSDRVYDGELMEIARELSLHVKHNGAGYVWDLEADAERTLLLDQYDDVSYTVYGPDGHALAGDAGLPQHHLPRAAATAYFDGERNGEAVRFALLRVAPPGSALGGVKGSESTPVTVQVVETLVKRNNLVRDMFFDVTLPQLLVILIAGGLVWFGVARGLSPLERLREAVASRSHLDLSPVPAHDAPAEVHPLLSSVNDLMARLNEVLTFQNRFIADAAHQLRTPVAGLKAHIELALREEEPKEIKRGLAHLYTGVQRMSHLVAQLLSLARNEPNTVNKLSLVPLDLNKLAFEVTMEWVPEAYKKDIDLGFDDAEKHVMIGGDAIRLTELLNNLLDNAIRYSQKGGRVTVRVNQEPSPRVSISDDGPSIPVEERQRVFERFHRLLGSHTDGSGLGLAIVREIASLHRAEISLDDDNDGVGNVFTVAFPGLVVAG
ncbi:MAG: two-component system response regulator [Betaproteobacteria bacterium]|nr:two-component system response regulator [Betaproteobacteria bacterium]